MRNTKKHLFRSALAMLLCFSMLLGTTFAWFTDSVTSAGNIISAGTLTVDLQHKVVTNEGEEWLSLKENTDHKVFDYDKWEPGYTQVDALKVLNTGTLALKYKLSAYVEEGTADLGTNGEMLSDVIDVYVTDGDVAATDFADIAANWTKLGTLSQVLAGTIAEGQLLPAGKIVEDGAPNTVKVLSSTVTLALHMREDAGNEYQALSLGNLYMQLNATQWTYEKDSFGDQYDANATYPISYNASVALDASSYTEEGGKVKLTADQTLGNSEGPVSATVPAGTLFEGGTTSVNLKVEDTYREETEETVKRTVDVHVDGVSEDNTTPILVTVKGLIKAGLNQGNYKLSHVEKTGIKMMTPVATLAEVDEHNEYYYDSATGDVTMALASFSDIVTEADVNPVWQGGFATYLGSGTDTDPYLIATADQLAQMSKDVSEKESYAKAHYRLVADLDFGGIANAEDPESGAAKNVFYPIGAWAKKGEKGTESANAAGETWYGLGYAFQGTFDGYGHTIRGICQRTWSMDGNYDNGYWKTAMGLFGSVFDATIKNLTIDGFESDGEFTPTGCVAAYAGGNSTFENISIINCNPRVYNTGNGGVVGLNYNSTEGEVDHLVFRNITVGASNKITALWGSWDVACAGILGRLRDNSLHTEIPGNTDTYNTAYFENCHVSAVIDVYNDVCANYQYYQYRYAGMFVGTVDYLNEVSGFADHTDFQPTKDGGIYGDGKYGAGTYVVQAANCTYEYGSWNEYWYCELVENSVASYTHDYQFSRLEKISNISEIYDDYGDDDDETGEWLRTGNFVLPDKNNDKDETKAKCYHIRKKDNGELYRHEHVMSGYHDGENGEKFIDEDDDGNADLKENRQHYYIPFGQLFTGYGWGARMSDDFPGMEQTFSEGEDKVQKFGKADNCPTYYLPGQVININDLFQYVGGKPVNSFGVYVSITGDDVKADYNGNVLDWDKGNIVFAPDSTGEATITITDYWYCNETKITLKAGSADKVFELTGSYGAGTADDPLDLESYDAPILMDNIFTHVINWNSFKITLIKRDVENQDSETMLTYNSSLKALEFTNADERAAFFELVIENTYTGYAKTIYIQVNNYDDADTPWQ